MPENLIKTEPQLTRLTKHMMCSVTQRFAFLYDIGIPEKAINQLDLEGSPAKVSGSRNRYLGTSWRQECQDFADNIMTRPLPEGIPE